MKSLEVRIEYRHVALHEQDAGADPLRLFRDWYRAAEEHGIEMPNAMVLATADAQGRPSARYVLLKGLDEGGFVFFSHLVSDKGRQLQENPRAALVFYWAPLHRQVRIEGDVEQVGDAESDAYFATRPRGSQIAVWAAPQSSTVPGREYLEQRVGELEREFGDGPVPRPETWVGFRVRPDRLEFWQGRESRLHDRLCFVPDGAGNWTRHRLAP